MQISAAEFAEQLKDSASRVPIIFIGMSGAGKTFWSKQFSNAFGYNHVEFDHLIGNSEKLAELLKDYEGKDEAEKMGNYFGMPWTDGFNDKERVFLGIEAGFMGKEYDPNSVLDLTGSAIYHPELMQRLADKGLVIYLETSDEVKAEMFNVYIKNPKPVCWDGVFQPQNGEPNENALKRCYPLLLQDRSRKYEQYADVTLPYEEHKAISTAQEFADAIQTKLS